MLRPLPLVFLATVFLSAAPAPAPNNFIDSSRCQLCHPAEYRKWSESAMARSFFALSPATQLEDFTNKNRYCHPASNTCYQMLVRDGVYLQRRYQLTPEGKETNPDEKQIDYVMGSGAHARTYLHRTATGALVELPLGWYAEKGGYWAMSPGYDKPDHPAARREIGYDCMFCHNSYPKVLRQNDRLNDVPLYSSGPLPQGIDCQRCHGPGERHLHLAEAAASHPEEVRAAIVNPSRLSASLQMDTCMQCHLETTSDTLPHAIRKYERGWFTYRAGEPLSDFLLAFDDSPANLNPDRFEIVSSAYRLRKSACFLKSNDRLKCTTCHDPHSTSTTPTDYNAACRSCHNATDGFTARVASAKHTSESACVTCHMPKRRTADVVHVAMTDHYIQRRPPTRDLLAELSENHEASPVAGHREVVPYLPLHPNALYRALAQVRDQSNLEKGIPQLERAIAAQPPTRPEPYFELAGALRAQSKLPHAEQMYREALRRDPDFLPAILDLGQTLRQQGKRVQALEMLRRATRLAPKDARTWSELGNVQLELSRSQDAIVSYRKAAELDPDMPEPLNGLGILFAQLDQPDSAEPEFRESIRREPSYAQAHANLAELLALRGEASEAAKEFEAAVRLDATDPLVHLNYALLLNQTRQFAPALVQVEAALQLDPRLAQAHDLRGNLYERDSRLKDALIDYREAVRLNPDLPSAQLDLGAVLSKTEDRADAIQHLRKAAASPNPSVQNMANQLLDELGVHP